MTATTAPAPTAARKAATVATRTLLLLLALVVGLFAWAATQIPGDHPLATRTTLAYDSIAATLGLTFRSEFAAGYADNLIAIDPTAAGYFGRLGRAWHAGHGDPEALAVLLEADPDAAIDALAGEAWTIDKAVEAALNAGLDDELVGRLLATISLDEDNVLPEIGRRALVMVARAGRIDALRAVAGRGQASWWSPTFAAVISVVDGDIDRFVELLNDGDNDIRWGEVADAIDSGVLEPFQVSLLSLGAAIDHADGVDMSAWVDALAAFNAAELNELRHAAGPLTARGTPAVAGLIAAAARANPDPYVALSTARWAVDMHDRTPEAWDAVAAVSNDDVEVRTAEMAAAYLRGEVDGRWLFDRCACGGNTDAAAAAAVLSRLAVSVPTTN